MARVIVIAPSLPPSPEPEALLAWRLANSLAESQHEIKLLTGRHPFTDFPPFQSRVEILQVFQRWSVFEIFKILPLLFQWRPQALHLIPPPQISPLWKIFVRLSDFFPHYDRPKVIVSFWRLPAKESRLSLTRVDVVTVANEWQKHDLSSFPGAQPTIETLNLINHRLPFDGNHGDLLPETFSPFVLIPGAAQDHEHFEQTLRIGLQVLNRYPNWHLVCLSSLSALGYRKEEEWRLKIKQSGISGRWYFAGNMDLIATTHLAKRADIVLGSHLRLDSPVMTFLTHTCFEHGRALILNSLQAQMDPLPWKHRHNALISRRSESDQFDQLQLLIDHPDLVKQMKTQLFFTAENTETSDDHFSNFLNRAYLTLTSTNRE